MQFDLHSWLDQFARQYQRQRAAAWMLSLFTLSILMLILFTLLDRWLVLSINWRTIGFCLIAAPLVLMVLLAILSLIPWRYNQLKMSRMAEQYFPQLEGRLSTWVSQLHYPVNQKPSQLFTDALNSQIAKLLDQTNWSGIRGRSVSKRHVLPLAVSLIILGLLLFIPDLRFPQLAARMLIPWKPIAPVTTTQILVQTGSVNVRQGASVTIVADITRPSGGAVLMLSVASTTPVSIDMQPLGNERYALTLPNLIRPAEYSVRCGDAESEIYRLQIIPEPDDSAISP